MVGPSLSIRPAIAITGFDILVLVLYLHVWLVVAGLAVRNDDAQTGIAWIDQRIHMSNRLYRNTARVPRGLTPRVNRVSYMTHPTVLMNTVVTWIKDRNPKQLPAVARKCATSQNPATAGATGVVGRGGAADPHGRTERSGVNSSRPILGRSRACLRILTLPVIDIGRRHRSIICSTDPAALTKREQTQLSGDRVCYFVAVRPSAGPPQLQQVVRRRKQRPLRLRSRLPT